MILIGCMKKVSMSCSDAQVDEIQSQCDTGNMTRLGQHTDQTKDKIWVRSVHLCPHAEDDRHI